MQHLIEGRKFGNTLFHTQKHLVAAEPNSTMCVLSSVWLFKSRGEGENRGSVCLSLVSNCHQGRGC